VFHLVSVAQFQLLMLLSLHQEQPKVTSASSTSSLDQVMALQVLAFHAKV
jgi:hypothetical protein